MSIITDTIIQQLGGRRVLKLMLGTTKIVIGNDAVNFNLQGCKKINKIRVLYRKSTDYYRVTFYYYDAPTLNLSVIQEYEDVSVDQLTDLITAETGLRMRMPTIRLAERGKDY